jgi:hypothetical protein
MRHTFDLLFIMIYLKKKLNSIVIEYKLISSIIHNEIQRNERTIRCLNKK